MSEVVFSPNLDPKPNPYATLNRETRLRLSEKALNTTLVPNALRMHPMFELEADKPEFVAWLRDKLGLAEEQWRHFDDTVNPFRADTHTDSRGDTVDDVTRFILTHQERLTEVYDNALAVHGQKWLETSTLVAFPLIQTFHSLMNSIRGESDGYSFVGPDQYVITKPIITQIDEMRPFYAKNGAAADQSIGKYVKSRIELQSGVDEADANDAVVDFFLVGNERYKVKDPTSIYSNSYDEPKNIKDLLRRRATSDSRLLGILEWYALTVQQPELMKNTGSIALSANYFSLNNMDFVACGSYSTEDEQFELNLLPMTSKAPEVMAVV
jgi:hypothetical protein